jgi:hypothetical protein
MIMTGKPLHDMLFKQLEIAPEKKKLFCKEHGLDSKSRMVLCAVPQHAEEGALSWEAHWEEIDALIKSFVAEEEIIIVLALHPRMKREAYKFLEDKYGVRISCWTTERVIPLCDVYVAYESSTLWMALQCNKPSINVLLKGYTLYDSFEGVSGFFKATSKIEITEHLKFILSEPEKVNEIINEGTKWFGEISGMAIQKITSLIHQEVA